MSTAAATHGIATADGRALSPGQWGLLSFLVSEVALFSTLIVTYVFYLGKDVVGPSPAEALSLSLVLFTTACLLASSGTVHLAERTLRRGNQGGFIQWWLATIVLGALFLVGTALEWQDLIRRHQLTISRNLFGTTYYTLVGLHALHVTAGLIVMVIVLSLAVCGQVTTANRGGVGLAQMAGLDRQGEAIEVGTALHRLALRYWARGRPELAKVIATMDEFEDRA